MKTKLICAAAFLLLCSSISEASDHKDPSYRGYPLDWCLSFEKDCGKPAADAFCRSLGHIDAKNFAKKSSDRKTMCIKNHAVCDPRHHGCDTFSFIECREKNKIFAPPMYRRYRLDWCLSFERDCGKPAADAFCKSQGFKNAKRFQKEGPVRVQTMCISNNAICNPAHHRCDSFSVIECE